MTTTAARPTRRSLVRGAAWSVPVISIAAAAPAFATSLAASGFTSAGTPVKWGTGQDPKRVSWDLLLTNGPADVITKVVIEFKYRKSNADPFVGNTFVIYGYGASSPTTWTSVISGGTVTATNLTDIPAGGVVNIHTEITGPDNSTGDVSATATFTYVDGTTRVVPIGILGTIQGTGGTEPAPHNTH